MAKKTIHAVMSEVLRSAGRPLSAQELYDTIRSRHLYEFRAQDPLNVVRNQLQRHCIDNGKTCAAAIRYFRITPDGLYDVLDAPVGKQ